MSVTALRTYGDSVMVGADASDAAHRFVNIIAARQGLTLTNNGINSTAVVDMCSSDINANHLFAVTPDSATEVLWEVGLNDCRLYGMDASHLADYQRILRAAMAFAARLPADVVQMSSGSWTMVGSWSALTVNGVDTKNSTTIGDTAQLTFTGDSVTVAYISHFNLPIGASDGGTFTVKVDTVLQDTISTAGTGYLSTYTVGGQGSRYVPMARRYSGFGAGSHTLLLTVNSAGSTQLAFACGSHPTSKPGPFVFITGNYCLGSTAYQNGSDEGIDLYTTRTTDIFNEGVADGLPVVIVRTNQFFVPANDLDHGDDVHPNDTGHAKMAHHAFLIPNTFPGSPRP